MNMKIKNFLTIFAAVILLQFFHTNLKAEEVKSIDEEELSAIDPFAKSATISATESIVETDSSAGDIMNNMRLIATVSGAHKKIAVLAMPDGRAVKYEENEFIFENLIIVEINSDYIVVSPNEGEEHEVYLTGQIKPREGNY